MRKGFAVGIMLMGAVLTLTACFLKQEQEYGSVRITIPPRSTLPQARVIGPKTIPANAEFIRVAVYDFPDYAVSRVATIPLLPGGSTTEISVPVGRNYTVAAISYMVDGERGYALTKDLERGVQIRAGEATPVSLDLQPWPLDVKHWGWREGETFEGGPVTSGEKIEVDASSGGGAGLNPRNAYLYTSTASFAGPGDAIPEPGKQWGSYPPWQFHAVPTPELEEDAEPVTMFIGFVFWLEEVWIDPDSDVEIYLFQPNRYLGEDLYEIEILPPPPAEGGVDLTIR